jgi:prepilin-type N-terminal cleavage/methylation domain-containing protein
MTSLPKKSRRGFTLVELVAVASIGTVLVSLASPAIQHAREAARRSQCKNNLKQIGLAIHNYHEAYGTLAPGWTNHTPHPGPGPRFGWSASILPFLDQTPLYQQLDWKSHRIDSREPLEISLAIYRCPSDTSPATNPLRGSFGTSNYSGNFGTIAPPRWLTGGMNPSWAGDAATPTKTDGIFWYNSKVRFRDCEDGLSNILCIGERCVASGSGIWMGVRGNNFENDVVSDFSVGNELNSGPGAFSSRHEGGGHFLLGDGAVRFVSDKIASGNDEGPGLYQDLGSRSDGRTVGEF